MPEVVSSLFKKNNSLSGILIITFLIGFDTTCMGLMIPAISKDIGFNVKDGAWLSISYAIGFSAFLLPSGIMSDKFGSKKIIIISMLVFIFTSILVTVYKSIYILEIIRLLQGISAAFLNTSALAMLSGLFPVTDSFERKNSFKLWSITLGASFALGPVVSGIMIDLINWKYIMWVNLPLGLFSLYMISKSNEIPLENKVKKKNISLISTIPITGIILLFFLDKINFVYNTFVFFGFLILFVMLIFLFHINFENSITRMPELKSIKFIIAMSIPVIFSISFWSLFIVLPQFINGFNLNNNFLSYMIVLMLALPISITPLLKVSSNIVNEKKWLTQGFVFLTIGLLLISYGVENISKLPIFIIGVLVTGIGAGILNPIVARIVMDRVSIEYSGAAAGLTSTLRQVGFALGVASLSFLTNQSPMNISYFSDQNAIILISSISFMAVILSRLL